MRACYNSPVSKRKQILAVLADGQFHSGTKLGELIGVSRAAIHKSVRILIEAGHEIHCVTGRGYRLAQPCRLLESREIFRYLNQYGYHHTGKLFLFDNIGSTSNFLAAQAKEIDRGSVCLAERQSGGRGRRGRSWVATPYHNILMSVSWCYQEGPACVSGLSLAAGVAVIDALTELGFSGVGLKWPNDIVWQGRKLAGLLSDVQGEAAGPSHVVLGIGLNVFISPREGEQIDQPWVDLNTIDSESIDRNQLVAALIRHICDMFQQFGERGLPAFHQRWQRLHSYQDQQVRVLKGKEVFEGVVLGIDAMGALQLRDNTGQVQSFVSGDISLRANQ